MKGEIEMNADEISTQIELVMFLTYKKELSDMDGGDDLPMSVYLRDFLLFQTDDYIDWVKIFDEDEEVGFLVVLRGEHAKSHGDGADYFIQDTYVEKGHRRKGLMKKTVTEYFAKHPGKYCMALMKENPGSHKFWESVISEDEWGDIKATRFPGLHKFFFVKKEEI